MVRTFKALLFLVLALSLTANANAQLVTYNFTGTKTYGITAGIGNKIAGTVTLDVGALPDNYFDFTPDYGSGFQQDFYNGNFSIKGVTDTGLTAGTLPGGFTIFNEVDVPTYPYHQAYIAASYDDGYIYKHIEIYGNNYAATGDGIPGVPNPWNPQVFAFRRIYFQSYDYVNSIFEEGAFSLDTFTVQSTNIIVDGRDTGIPDFDYLGKTVTQHIADLAPGAKNHGAFVSGVAKLTNDLTKAGLLTGNQKGIIQSYAGQSSIGKK
jgi:hypothetical protein